MHRRGLFAITMLTGAVVGLEVALGWAGEDPSIPHGKQRIATSDTTRALACNLAAMTPDERRRHLRVTKELRAAVAEVKELRDGYTFRFEAEPVLILAVAEFISLESRCCPFFTFNLELVKDCGPMWLRVTGPTETKPFIHAALAS